MWKKYKWILKYVIVVFIVVIAAYGIYAVINYNQTLLESQTCEERGTFGDMFGYSNAIFSALAFLGVIITIILQMLELREQREELKLTRKEFNQQNETLSLQRFENTFFQLLGVHHSIVDGMEMEYTQNIFSPGANSIIKTAKKREVFKQNFQFNIKGAFINERSPIEFDLILKSGHNTYNFVLEKANLDKIQAAINQIYGEEIYFQVQLHFSHYFRNLYRIFKFVDTQEFYSFNDLQTYYKDDNLSYEEETHLYIYLNRLKKYEYTSMVRAQLSDYELWWLTFNCLWVEGKKFKDLVEKYTILKNHPSKDVMKHLNQIGLYDEAAYEKDKNPFLYDFSEYRENLIKVIEEKELENFNMKESVNLKTANLLKRFINEKK